MTFTRFNNLLLALSLLLVSKALVAEPVRPAPDFELNINSSQNVSAQSLHQLSEQGYVYLDFWASWCGPCRYSFPFMNRLKADLGKHGLTVVAVNVDAVSADAEPFLVEHPADFAIHYDPSGEVGSAYNVRGMPSSFLIKDGQILVSHVGFRRSDADKLFDEIAAIVRQGSKAN